MDLRNLDSTKAFQTLDGSTIRELAGPRTLPARNQSLAEATVAPGTRTMAHHHPRSEELYFFIAGSGTLRIGTETRPVRAGDCAVIPPGTSHQLINPDSEPLVLLCCCSPPYNDGDTVLEED